MSITPTAGSAAPNSSGRCVMHGADQQAAVAAALNRQLRRRVYLFAISHSAAAMKSSNTFCLLSFVPASCHSSPYSPPPRRLADRVHAAHLHPRQIARR